MSFPGFEAEASLQSRSDSDGLSSQRISVRSKRGLEKEGSELVLQFIPEGERDILRCLMHGGGVKCFLSPLV
jgi:hypothetical protein